MDSSATALDALMLHFGEDTFQLLPTGLTYVYALQTPPGTSYKWNDTNAQEMQLFVDMILAMRIHQLDQLEDHEQETPKR
jgi:hypothetical protein